MYIFLEICYLDKHLCSANKKNMNIFIVYHCYLVNQNRYLLTHYKNVKLSIFYFGNG